MHNGGIPEFEKIKRDLCNMMTFESYRGVSGSTDSEHIFALFLSLLECRDSALSAEEISTALQLTFCKILNLAAKHNVSSACSLNVCITDGVHVIASRYRNSDADPPSLYYAFGREYSKCVGNFRDMKKSHRSGQGVIITSSPLNRTGYMVDCLEGSASPGKSAVDGCSGSAEAVADDTNWRLIPKNHLLVCEGIYVLY